MPFFYNLFWVVFFIPSLILLGCASANGNDAPDVGPINIDAKDFSVDSLSGDKYIVHLKLQTPDGKPATWCVCDGGCGFGGRDNEDHIDRWNKQAKECKTFIGDSNNFEAYTAGIKYEDVSVISHDFLVCGNECEEGCAICDRNLKLEIALIRDNYMFVEFPIETDKEMLGSQKEITPIHEWTAGTWGLAPWGTYESKETFESGTPKIKKTLLTVIYEGVVLLNIGGGGGPGGGNFPLSNYNSYASDHGNFIDKGTIADDLSSITFYRKYKDTAEEVNATIFKK